MLVGRHFIIINCHGNCYYATLAILFHAISMQYFHAATPHIAYIITPLLPPSRHFHILLFITIVITPLLVIGAALHEIYGYIRCYMHITYYWLSLMAFFCFVIVIGYHTRIVITLRAAAIIHITLRHALLYLLLSYADIIYAIYEMMLLLYYLHYYFLYYCCLSDMPLLSFIY